MTVLVCGGRDFVDKLALFAVLDTLHEKTPITRLVHGAATGADSLGAAWALVHRVKAAAYKPQWEAFGKSAGVRRNQEMIDVEPIDLVVACPGGRGTADMLRRAKAREIPVMMVESMEEKQ